MILTVTMNPAYDLTYHVERLEHGVAQRVTTVERHVGGKGVNVARVLVATGIPVMATGFADKEFAREVGAVLPADFVTALPWVRRTVVITEADGTTTGLWEPGAELADPAAVRELRHRFGELLLRSRGVVISGSLPRGVDASLPAELAAAAVAAGVPVVCDVDGEALRQATRVQGVVLMPNTDELRALTGRAPRTLAESVAAALPLVTDGAGAVIVTRGPEGIVAVTATSAWSVRPPESVTGNPTGAGDAAAAAVIAGLATASTRTTDWPAVLADAVATSAAAVAMPVAGAIDPVLRARVLAKVQVQRLSLPDIQESPCL